MKEYHFEWNRPALRYLKPPDLVLDTFVRVAMYGFFAEIGTDLPLCVILLNGEIHNMCGEISEGSIIAMGRQAVASSASYLEAPSTDSVESHIFSLM